MKLTGSMTALATPFKAGTLDEAAYEALVEYQVTNGTSVLVPGSRTFNSTTLPALNTPRAYTSERRSMRSDWPAACSGLM